MSGVRWRTRRSRVRKIIDRACCSSVLTATKRIVSRVVLLALHTGLHVDRRNQPYRMAELPDNAPPFVGCRAGFHCHNAMRLSGQKRQKFGARQLLAKGNVPVARGAMHLEDPLREVDTDDGGFFHDLLLLLFVFCNRHFGTLRTVGMGIHSISLRPGPGPTPSGRPVWGFPWTARVSSSTTSSSSGFGDPSNTSASICMPGAAEVRLAVVLTRKVRLRVSGWSSG